MNQIHKSVLLKETIDGLGIKSGDTFVDATLNSGGHSEEVLKRFGAGIKVIGIDIDPDAIKRARTRLQNYRNVSFVNRSFGDLKEILEESGVRKIDRIIYDLGLSSNQIEESGKGFTFQKDEPLYMTMGSIEGALTAETIVNEWGEESIADIIYGFGEERFARRIAKQIVLAREVEPIKTTFALVEIILSAVPVWYRFRKIHPATKTFQALRIAVNSELSVLRKSLAVLPETMSKEGRVAIISFHSLEDRISKTTFMDWEKKGLGKRITKKPITAGNEELKENPRSRSAKLRIFEFYGSGN